MRRKSVSAQEIERLVTALEVDYDVRSWEIDAGPKMLTISAPDPADSTLRAATARSTAQRMRSEELLHGRDGLAPAPESTGREAPQWSELWPSARAMAAYFGHCVRMRSVDAVDVSCGLGTAGLGAAAKGARVELLHHDPEALRFAKLNAMQNGFPHVTTREFDWKTDRLPGNAGSLIFADVLYSEENFEHVFRMLADNLSPGRTAFLAEPGRLVATSFFEALRLTNYRVRLDMERVEDVHSENYYLVSILRIKKED
jgi:2-polyprenyl-3-methyl-5-hydroxy-6-metoxy-1,4-benzoquinol methylase